MNINVPDDSAAVTNAFESVLSNYSRVMELISEMRDTPLCLAESGEVCDNCLVRLAACTAVLLRKISDTGHDQFLEECMMAIHPELLCEQVPPMPQRSG